jgi:hypothetical protein
MIKCFVCYIEFVGINKKDDEVHLEKNGWDTFTILCSISSPLWDWKMCMDICNLKYGTNRKSLFWVGINNICSHILLSVAFFFSLWLMTIYWRFLKQSPSAYLWKFIWVWRMIWSNSDSLHFIYDRHLILLQK